MSLLFILLAATAALAQTSSFTYQGRLTDGGTAANGNYDLQFALWDSASGGLQIGSTLTFSPVAVSNGVFSVSLDFGASSFNGASRFLEISARPISGGTFTLLSPRQPVTATPYAIRSLNAAAADTATNATQLGGVTASQFVQANDSRLADARTPTAGSTNYIQNTTSQQSSTNFNISGDGNAAGTLSGNIVNAATQFNLGGNRVFTISGGLGVSTSNTNTVGGVGAGASLAPVANSVFGNFNTFFGRRAGNATTSGHDNALFGMNAGLSNTTGSGNSFFGQSAGLSVQDGTDNSFFGGSAGGRLTSGSGNSFFGSAAGVNDDSGVRNTALGSGAGSFGGLTNATAIGALALVQRSNSLVLGSINGVNNATDDTNVGIGTTKPLKRLEVGTTAVADGINLFGNAPAYFLADINNAQKAALGFAASAGQYSADAAAGDIVLRATTGRLILQHASAGAGMIFNSAGTVSIPTLGAAGGTSLCRNNANEISTCSSSLRYKTNVLPFPGGLDIISHLRPISFTWKDGGKKDIGLGAEEVEKVEPLLTFRNDKGEIEGVKYNQLSAVFINAFKEEQAQIEAQRLTIEQQQAELIQQERQLKVLKSLVCRSHRRATVCK